MGISASTAKRALTEIAQRDRRVRRAIDVVGFPPGRTRAHGFPTLLRIVVGQQVSTKAAAAIYSRVEEKLKGDVTPEKVMRVRATTLRAAGLSERKVAYSKGLARALTRSELDLAAMKRQSDEEVIDAITALRGFGVWSAQMYLMSSLGRLDVWPIDDLGVQNGVQRILALPDRPHRKEMEALAARWRPYRSAMALLCWHYLHNAPI
ncbi:MAG: DNA-3-methyladenine glycosylase 2 family protein [Myxococcota bacterium]